jgi:hypothetical protein
VSREQLPYMSDEQFNRVAFVYRSKTDGVRVVGLTETKNYEDKTKWEHLATLDSHSWIECLLRNNSRERNKQIKEILK